MASRDDKRAKFTGKDAQKKTAIQRIPILAVICIAVILGGYFVFKSLGPKDPGYVDVTQTGSGEQPLRIDAVNVVSENADGKITIPVESVKSNKLVEFSFSKDGKEVPLLAYVTDSGKVKAAVRMCEPCNSKSFHLEGDEIVCNACGTRWKLEDLSGVSGGCLTYPPDQMGAEQKDGKLVLSQEEVMNWKPRV